MIDFKKMKEVADKIESATTTEERVNVLHQMKNEFVLATVGFICTEYREHLKECENEDCDFLESMCAWLEGHTYDLRVQCHANVIINMHVKQMKGKWPLDDEEMREKLEGIRETIAAQMAQGMKEGFATVQAKPPKGKQH